MSFVYWLIGIAVALVIIFHFFSNFGMGSIGRGEKEYRQYLKKGPGRGGGGAVTDIHPPPSGQRDMEVENLIRSGRINDARNLLGIKMEEARIAPIGSQRKMRDISHYLSLLG
ncbi:MAG TPA: hypothetical protein VGB30_14400 [bacterium]|jgi:hypothetical protein